MSNLLRGSQSVSARETRSEQPSIFPYRFWDQRGPQFVSRPELTRRVPAAITDRQALGRPCVLAINIRPCRCLEMLFRRRIVNGKSAQDRVLKVLNYSLCITTPGNDLPVLCATATLQQQLSGPRLKKSNRRRTDLFSSIDSRPSRKSAYGHGHTGNHTIGCS